MDFTQIKQLLTDEDAVSPVIGVILMVAITVILAAVIGTFVLGLGENVQDSAPQANFQFEYTAAGGNGFETSGSADSDSIDITHTGGEDISVSELSVQVGDDSIDDVGTAGGAVTTAWDSTVSTGGTLTLTEEGTGPTIFEGGDTVRVVWTSPSGSSSNTIGQSTVPS